MAEGIDWSLEVAQHLDSPGPSVEDNLTKGERKKRRSKGKVEKANENPEVKRLKTVSTANTSKVAKPESEVRKKTQLKIALLSFCNKKI